MVQCGRKLADNQFTFSSNFFLLHRALPKPHTFLAAYSCCTCNGGEYRLLSCNGISPAPSPRDWQLSAPVKGFEAWLVPRLRPLLQIVQFCQKFRRKLFCKDLHNHHQPIGALGSGQDRLRVSRWSWFQILKRSRVTSWLPPLTWIYRNKDKVSKLTHESWNIMNLARLVNLTGQPANKRERSETTELY